MKALNIIAGLCLALLLWCKNPVAQGTPAWAAASPGRAARTAAAAGDVSIWQESLPPRCVVVFRHRGERGLIQRVQGPLASRGWCTVCVDIEAAPEIVTSLGVAGPCVSCFADGCLLETFPPGVPLVELRECFDEHDRPPAGPPDASVHAPPPVVTGWSVESLRDALSRYSRLKHESVGITGMTPLTHLTRDHGWELNLVSRLNETEQRLLHDASHDGRIVPSVSGSELVYFTAPWCAHCVKIKSLVEDARRRGVPVRVVDADAGTEDELRGIEALPAIVVISRGLAVFSRQGTFSANQLAQMESML